MYILLHKYKWAHSQSRSYSMSLEIETVCFTLELISLEERTLISRMRDTYTIVILNHFLECFHGALQHRYFQQSSYKFEPLTISHTTSISLHGQCSGRDISVRKLSAWMSLTPPYFLLLCNNAPASLKYPWKLAGLFAFLEELNTCHNRICSLLLSHIPKDLGRFSVLSYPTLNSFCSLPLYKCMGFIWINKLLFNFEKIVNL